MEIMTFREAVRKRPSMYIGDVSNAGGANNMVFELIANVLDQFLANAATRCEVELRGFELTIEDDGPGLPFHVNADNGAGSQAEHVLENAHFGATASGHAPHVHLVFNGVGLAVVNALCSEFTVVSSNGHSTWSHAYETGNPKGRPNVKTTSESSGTRLVLRLDQEVFNCPPDQSYLRSTLREKSHLFPGFEIVFNGSSFIEAGGLMSLAGSLCDGDERPTLWYRQEYADFQIDLALAGSGSAALVSQSWVNGSPTADGGTHDDALMKALRKASWKPKVSLVHVIMLQPEFAGPTKNKLWAPSLKEPLEAAFSEALASKLRES
ncbi:MAG: hypothetical protein AAGA08_01725 [Pseudomonadota bacterium]